MRVKLAMVLFLAVLAGGAAVVWAVERGGSAVAADAVEPPRPAAQPPRVVVFMTFDEFPVDVLRLPDGHIDPARFPNLAAFARTATWFPNTQAVHDSTEKALPAILDGRLPPRNGRGTLRWHPRNLFTLFAKHGYKVVASEEATSLCPVKVCPNVVKRKPTLENIKSGRRERWDRWIAQIKRRPGRTLYYKHLLLPHLPWIYLPSGRETRVTLERLANVAGFGDRWLTLHNEQRMLLQAGFVDHQLGRIFARLKKLGLFDQALIVITADHGIAFEVGVRDRRQVTRSNVDEVAPVPFLIKAPGQRHGSVVDALVRTVDVLPTVAYLAGLPTDWRVDGRQAFDPVHRRRRTVSIPKRDFSATVRISLSEWNRRRRANIRERARIYGTGPASTLLRGSPWASLYAFGDSGKVVGASVRSVASGAASVRAQLLGAELFRNVDPRARTIPVQVAGWIEGGRAGARRRIAVAVNGRVAAVGSTFHMRGDRRELFSLVIPESVLRRGRNDVAVYELGGTGRGERLLRIASY